MDELTKAFIKGNKLTTSAKLRKIEDGYRVYSTGSLGLDIATGQVDPIDGNGGIPEGTLCEVFGRTGSGKNITLEHVILDMQKKFPEGMTFILFAEDPVLKRMEDVGIDMSRVIPIETDDLNHSSEFKADLAEIHLQTLCKAAMLPNTKICAVDSIKALISTKQILDKKGKDLKELDADEMAIRAKLITKFIEEWIACTKNHANYPLLMLLNQVSDQIGNSFIVGEELRVNTPGGRFKEHMAKLRIKQDSTSLKNAEHPLFGYKNNYGMSIHYKLVKNKLPGNTTGQRAVTSEFLFEKWKEGDSERQGKFNKANEILAYAGYLGLIKAGGGGNYEIEGNKVRGQNKAIELLSTNKELCATLERQIISRGNELFESKTDKQDLDSE